MDLLVSQLNLNSARELLPSEHIEVVTGARGSGEAESSVGDRIFLWSYHRRAEQHEVHIYGREITAIRTAEQERSRALAELERGKRNQAIGQLAGGFAHDFNNLLAVIAGYTDLALEQPSEDEILRGHLEQVRVAAERGRSIVNQILAFARGERVQFEKVDAKAMLVEVLALLRGSLADEVSPISDLGDGSSDDFQVNGDMVKLEQVVMNLVNNAEHALPTQSGEIRVSLCREASYVVIRVSDNGRGMPPDVRERIFEPYFTTKRMSGGTGLGLAMVHGIIEEHSGLIEVESEEGRGTTFTIRLPKFDSNLDQVASELRRMRPLGSRKPTTKMGPETKIMVVDDEAALARLAVRVLDRFGLRAESFTDPELALQTLVKNSGAYSVVITDQSMPGLTGLELMREVREKCPDIPVILCSGYGVELTEEQVLAGGGEALLWKPVDWDALVSLVRELSG